MLINAPAGSGVNDRGLSRGCGRAVSTPATASARACWGGPLCCCCCCLALRRGSRRLDCRCPPRGSVAGTMASPLEATAAASSPRTSERACTAASPESAPKPAGNGAVVAAAGVRLGAEDTAAADGGSAMTSADSAADTAAGLPGSSPCCEEDTACWGGSCSAPKPAVADGGKPARRPLHDLKDELILCRIRPSDRQGRVE